MTDADERKQKSSEIELEPDAWERFERAVKVVAKSPPQHKTKKAKDANPKDARTQSKKERKEKC